MNSLKLLLVEDDLQELDACRATVERYEHARKRKLELVECMSVEDALSRLDNSYDGAIIDLKLGIEGNEGNDVIRKIEESYFRIPILVLTGTPDPIPRDSIVVEIFKKGETGAGYDDLFDRLWEIYDTGLTKIMGGRGLLERRLWDVYERNLLRQRDQWVHYAKDNPTRTEKALLRHTLNHLSQLLEEEDQCFPEEMYLAPPLSEKIQTGSIVKERQGDKWFVILNPACDLVLRKNGKPKTDWILVVEIDTLETLISWLKERNPGENIKPRLKKALRNNETTFHHCLPKTGFFEGGFLNFRKLCTVGTEELTNRFQTPPTIQIAPSFIKDVISRFSTYYARQGQPDVDVNTVERNWVSDTE